MDNSAIFRTRRPKVVSIPVQFVQSEQTRSASALKIQKVLRGFLLRKSVKQILGIMRNVEEIERWIESEKAKEAGIDAKERLRVSETLMSLLLKLDSVRGINSGVRDCRKSVIKKAIALQEKVDNTDSRCMDAGEDSTNAQHDNQSDQVPEMIDTTEEEPKTIHCMTDDVMMRSSPLSLTGSDDDSPEDEEDPSSEGKDVLGDLVEEDRDRKRTRELLERMAEDNGKLVGMVRELSEKNEMQMRLLSSLTQRVELLEKALVSEKLARMKKKKRHVPNPNPN